MGSGSDSLRILSCILVGVILRWSIAQFPYSGQGKPPKYGDYEAQRHWMEITIQTPIEDWYMDSPDNDLQYWGLDYPPLSAFHSYGLGVFFWNIIPESVKLFTSRGYESPEHKFWMRLTVLMSDLLVPSFVIFSLLNKPSGKVTFVTWTSVLLAMVAPPFILIDHAHFQYNCISLGLTVLAITCIGKEQMSIAAILFTLAVNYKQMSLYHAVPFFVQMVSVIIFKKKDALVAFRVTLMILSTMGMLWLPFGDNWVDVLQRIFPIKRGVYEDKVGSFWYVLDRFIPLKKIVEDSKLAQLCGIASAFLLIPGVVHLFKFTTNKKSTSEETQKAFLLSLLNVSLILFLFSYHVHEKSIMLAVLPAVLLFRWYPLPTVWFTIAASVSLYPLLREEGSHLALISLTTIFFVIAYQGSFFGNLSAWVKLLLSASILGYVTLVLGLHFVPPPTKLPHIFQAGIAIFSFLHYATFSLYFHSLQFHVGGPGEVKEKLKSKKKQKKSK